MLFEIRCYRFEPTKFEEYKVWLKDKAWSYFSNKMNIVGFWLDNGMPPIYGGSQPPADDVLPANITWIVQWRNREQRDKVWDEVMADPECKTLFSTVPGGMNSYLRMEVRFATQFE